MLYGKDRPDSGYPDTVKVEEGDYLDDRKEGHWIKYNIDGSIRVEGDYVNNRPFHPTLEVYPPSKVKEVSDCSFGKTTDPPKTKPVEPVYKIPYCSNFSSSWGYKYIAPKYSTTSYFPLLYMGKNTDTIAVNFYGWLYPPKEELTSETAHTVKDGERFRTVTSSNLRIAFSPERFWVPQPSGLGEDTMEYHSASTVVLFNTSSDTLVIGKNATLNVRLQYFADETWQETKPNPEPMFPYPELEGTLLLYPGEMVVTAVPLFKGKHRRLRIAVGECISEEFSVAWN